VNSFSRSLRLRRFPMTVTNAANKPRFRTVIIPSKATDEMLGFGVVREYANMASMAPAIRANEVVPSTEYIEAHSVASTCSLASAMSLSKSSSSMFLDNGFKVVVLTSDY